MQTDSLQKYFDTQTILFTDSINVKRFFTTLRMFTTEVISDYPILNCIPYIKNSYSPV